MATFTLPEVDNISGKQLADEIFQATGITITLNDVLYQGNGIVFIRDELVQGYEVQIQAIVDAHSIDLNYFPEDVEIIRLEEVQLSGEIDAQSIQGWATWNKVSANDWFSANVESLLSAIPNVDGLTPTQFQSNAQAIIAQMQDIITNQATVINALGQMIIALRNNTWPNLEENE